MFGVICPSCAFKQNKSLSERKKIASKLERFKHYICDNCGAYMYQSYYGTRWSFDMEDIMFHVREDDPKLDIFDYLNSLKAISI